MRSQPPSMMRKVAMTPTIGPAIVEVDVKAVEARIAAGIGNVAMDIECLHSRCAGGTGP